MELKTCIKCKESKELSAFSRYTSKREPRRNKCKACSQQEVAEWKVSNPEKVKLSSKKWHENRREVNNLRSQEYKEANPTKVKELVFRWKKANKGLVNLHNVMREQRIQRATAAWIDLKKTKQIYTLAAKWNELWPEDPVHVDHIIPLKGKNVSGLHTELNLQILRAADNMKKSNKLLDISST